MFEFWAELAEWSRSTFGSDEERGPVGPLKHLEKEAREAYEEQNPNKQKVEIADCLFLVFDAARRAGMSYKELCNTAFDKLEVNRKRVWPRPTSTEPVEDVRSSAE